MRFNVICDTCDNENSFHFRLTKLPLVTQSLFVLFYSIAFKLEKLSKKLIFLKHKENLCTILQIQMELPRPHSYYDDICAPSSDPQ